MGPVGMSNTINLPKENLTPTDPKFFKKKPLSICKALIETFSTNNRRCHPSWANKHLRAEAGAEAGAKSQSQEHIRLITIGPSHYCEKARWGLDLIEADPSSPYYYTEDAHPPIFASIATLEASDGQASMTPMVVCDSCDNSDNDNDNGSCNKNNTKVIYDSTNILQQFCPFLYPPTKRNDILEMESYLGRTLGTTVRIFLYYNFLQSEFQSPSNRGSDMDGSNRKSKLKQSLANVASSNSSSIEKLLFAKLLDKGITYGLIKAMGISPDSSKLSLQIIRDVFQEISQRLELDGDNDDNDDDNDDNDHSHTNFDRDHSKNIQHQTQKKKKYIMDTHNQCYGFTAADLTFAALAAPIIAPPEINPFMEHREHVLPKEIVALKYELRNTLAGRHVLDMYKHHRCCFDNHKKMSNNINANTNANANTNTTGSGNYGMKKNQVVIPKLVGRDKIPLGVVLGVGALACSIFSFASYQKKGEVNNRRSLFHSRL